MNTYTARYFRTCVIIVVFSFLLLFVRAVLRGETPNSLFMQANQYYTQKEYDKALVIYNRVMEEHGTSGSEIYYNKGNCYFKLNQLGRAIVEYKRAFYLDPRDKDINHNLNYARSLVDLTVEDNRNWYVRTADRLLRYLSAYEVELAVYILIGLVLGIHLVLLFWPGVRSMRLLRLIFILAVVIAGGIACGKKIIFPSRYDAVVIESNAAVRYGPLPSEKTVFRLTEGIEVTISEQKGKWYHIELTNGQSGWINEAYIQPVHPGFAEFKTV